MADWHRTMHGEGTGTYICSTQLPAHQKALGLSFIRTPWSDDMVLGRERRDGSGLAARVWRRDVWSLAATSGQLGSDHPVGNLANKTCHTANNVAKERTIKPLWTLTPPLLCDLKKKKEFVFQVSLNLNWRFLSTGSKRSCLDHPNKMARVQLAT